MFSNNSTVFILLFSASFLTSYQGAHSDRSEKRLLRCEANGFAKVKHIFKKENTLGMYWARKFVTFLAVVS
jgi:hypothetical protein